LLIANDRILFAGDADEARNYIPAGATVRTLDLKGATVVPGLTDAHIHFHMFSFGLQEVNAETPSLEEALSAVAAMAAAKPAGAWIKGYGWNHNVWGGAFPHAADLDRVSNDHPVCLGAKSGHAVWVNSKAMQLAGIDRDTPDPSGGVILHDESGQPTGVLLEDAMALAERIIPAPTLEDVISAYRQGMAAANRAGLTAVHDMDGVQSLQAWQALRLSGEISLRVVKSIPFEHLDEALGLGIRSGLGDEWVRIGGVKMFADGALGPQTAWMLADYENAPGMTGISTTPPEVLRAAVLHANAAGLSTNIHAIGDRANREVLNIYAEALEKLGKTGLRNRIEHVQLIDPADCGRLAQLGVIASMQPIHATSDMDIAEQHWGARSVNSYAWKSQLKAGAVLALGSDCPVETLDPLQGLHAAVTRRRADGSPSPHGWYPEQRLTVAEAVRGYTAGPAYAAGLEDRLGCLAPGCLADLTVIDRDIYNIDPHAILQAHVIKTMVGGKWVWQAE
jgi:predicted amidohydrolase YtcJ